MTLVLNFTVEVEETYTEEGGTRFVAAVELPPSRYGPRPVFVGPSSYDRDEAIEDCADAFAERLLALLKVPR